MASHCAQLSHPPTHWQIFFTRPTLRLLCNRFPGTCHEPGRGASVSFSAPSRLLAQGSRQTVLHCAHRTSTVLSCAFCGQEGWFGGSLSHLSETARCASTGDHQARPLIFLPSSLAYPLSEGHPCWSTCGRRTRPFSGRAFREHRTNVGALPIFSSWRLCEQEGHLAAPHPILALARNRECGGGKT